MIDQIIRKLAEADMVLVGLGEELDALNEIRQERIYKELNEELSNFNILPYAEKLMIEEKKKSRQLLYKSLADKLQGKNYFVITTCLDGLVRGCGLNEERIVEPCGSYDKLQCSEKCRADLYDVPKELIQQAGKFLEKGMNEKDFKEPTCPYCGASLIFNNVNAQNYLEEGYLDKWKIYKKWLQGTINKKVCLLEIGVGMKYPTVIRWPFEKITFYNQKAELFRIHSRIYQITGEIKERGYGICQKPEEFLKELSKGF